jgi:methyltransferase (TIGR00027 family)
MLRSIESQKPEGERICYDPLAHFFVPGGFGAFLSKAIVSSPLYDRLAPGAMAFIVGRERFFDDYLVRCLEEGLDQLVILGAGFDTRPCRIQGMENVRVFEIDRPATQATKLANLKKALPALPPNVSFVPMDFNTQSLGERLASAGYDERAKTVFLWQGVVYFLTPVGVDSTLAFMVHHSGPGSSVVFDYFYSETIDPSSRMGKQLRAASRISGEAYLFGIDKGNVTAFLEARGFSQVQDLTMDELKELYFTGPNAHRILQEGIAIATARVEGLSAR